MSASRGGLTAESEVVEGSAELEQECALAAGQLERGTEVGLAVGRRLARVSTEPEQLGVVERHSGVTGQFESGVHFCASPTESTGRGSHPAPAGPLE
jgi:hypothetical protein